MDGFLSNPKLISLQPHDLFSRTSASISNKYYLFIVLVPIVLPVLVRLFQKLHYVINARQILIDGVQKHGSKPFDIHSLLGRITVLPRKYLPEIRSSHFSFCDYIDDAYPLTGVRQLFEDRGLSTFIKRNLVQSLERYSDDLNDEIKFVSKLLLDNKTVTAKPVLTEFSGRVLCRIFAGPKLCRDQKWLSTMLEFTEYIGFTGMVLRLVPKRLAWYFAVLLPGYWSGQNAMMEAKKIREEDYMQQLFLSTSAIHTTAGTLTQFVYDLCCYPEVVELLRKELEAVGTDNLQKLEKMDSFMKESHRLHPVKHAGMQRKATADITLSDGVHIKKGQYIMVASTPVQLDEKLYPDPEKFDPLRFYKLRQKEGMDLYQYTASTDEFFGFSRGPHTCPGRFFSGHMLKLTLAHFLMEYDLSFPGGKTQCPKRFDFEDISLPNLKQKVVFTKRNVS